MTQKEHRTLFAVDLREQRTRKRMVAPQEKGKGSGATSDVRRHRLLLAAAVVASVAALVGFWLVPPTTSSRGAVALPHRAAEIACADCHGEATVRGPAPSSACRQCHGDHASVRDGHRRMEEAGTLTCVRCHDVHGADQGVRFVAPTGEATRYGVGIEVSLSEVRLPTVHDVTVPLIDVGRCAQNCHDPSDANDPIARCLSADGRVSLCFDEHQSWSAVAPPRAGGVCASQHGNDRFAAWDAARRAASAAPLVASSPNRLRRWRLWLGIAGAFLGGLGYVVVARVRQRISARKKAAAPVAKPAERVRLPQIDVNTCLGCYACVDACPYDVLAIDRYVAEVRRPDICCGLTLCEQVCPNGSLVITDGDPIGDRPKLADDLSAMGAPGVFLAGDVTGLPLIKNAIRQGAQAVENIQASLSSHASPLDVVIVGAGPAGISAALKAKELGLRFEIVEQGGVAQSIRNFPRGKLVFDQPLELPLTGKLWLAESTKEELLQKWMRVIREERIMVREQTRFEALERSGDEIVVVTHEVDTGRIERFRTARVLLAVGMRGSPRKLPVTLDARTESKVFYHLADARSFASHRVLVVGLGDVAMECAIALSHQPDTEETVVARGEDFSRGKARNIEELRRLARAGRVDVRFNARVEAIGDGEVHVLQDGHTTRIDNDVVFVMIGSHPPRALLEKAGVDVGIGV